MKKKAMIVVSLVFSLFVLPSVAYGVGDEKTSESTTGNTAPTGFEYQVVRPENQISDSGYFDLKMTPGQKQTLHVKIKNTGDSPITLNIELNGTKTNSNGVVEWGPSAVEKDASLKYDFVDIAKAPTEITVKPKSEEDIPIELTMPDASYDGVIAGGIRLMSKDQEQPDSNATIINRYANLIGVLLKETEKKLQPELTFNKVYAGLSNYRGSVFVNYSNTNAVFLSDMSVEAQIMGKDSDEVLYDKKQSGMAMAPNSQITIPVSMEGDEMKPGDYRAHVLVTVGKEKWEWTEAFTITKEEADKFNQEDVGVIQERGIDWKLIAMIVGGGVVLALILFVGIRQVNKKKQAKLAAERKQKKRAQQAAKNKKSKASERSKETMNE